MPRLRSKTRARHDDHAGCSSHPMEPAIATCASCHRNCCTRCSLNVRPRVLCMDCGMTKAGVRVRRR